MPRVGGLEVLEEMARSRRGVPTIVLSGMEQVNMVVKAMRLGASDYLVKPFGEADLERAVQSALEEGQPSTNTGGGAVAPREVISCNPRMIHMRDLAAQVADTDVPVLILGESGVGKEVMARHIHNSSSRRSEQMLKVNCAALPSELLESELFGYERGAFTGALRDKPGKFELAGRGTIFLDEIGEMSPLLQAKLLHVLQDGEFTRLGGTKPQCSSARVLAATNQRLEECVAEGTFREDLYYRLNVIRLEIPPLRDRREENNVRLCARFLINVYSNRYKRPLREIPAELMDGHSDLFVGQATFASSRTSLNEFVILPDVQVALEAISPITERVRWKCRDWPAEVAPACGEQSRLLRLVRRTMLPLSSRSHRWRPNACWSGKLFSARLTRSTGIRKLAAKRAFHQLQSASEIKIKRAGRLAPGPTAPPANPVPRASRQ